MSGPYSGKWAAVNGISTVRDWSINDAHDSKPYVASNTKFGKGRRRGIESWDGSYNHYGHTPVVLPGELFQFIGYGAPTNNISGAGLRYVGNAMCQQNVITLNWGGGDIISVQESFNGHLALSEQGSSGAEILDATVPTVPQIACTKIEYSADGNDASFTEWGNLVQAVITLSCELQEYVNSSTVVTDSGVCRIWKGFRPGPIDWTLAVTEQNMDRSIFKKGDSRIFRVYVTDSLYYEFKWGMVKDFTGIQYNRETGAIVQQTVNIEMDGFDPTETTYDPNSIGQVLLPGGDQWFPIGAATGTGA